MIGPVANDDTQPTIGIYLNGIITDMIYDMYERYHVERIENAFEDIDALVREKGCQI